MPRSPWKKYGSYRGRRTNFREVKQSFLIVCEGLKSEPLYFEGFKVPKEVIVDIHPGAGVHISVVNEAIKRKATSEIKYDHIWCVFDRDKNPRNRKDTEKFNQALLLAKNNNIEVAYSNDAFELWYLLHFSYHDTATHRHDYITKLELLIDGGYKKNDPAIYAKLEDRMEIAIKNSKKLLSTYKQKNPTADDPSTTVHLLVEQLRKYSHTQ